MMIITRPAANFLATPDNGLDITALCNSANQKTRALQSYAYTFGTDQANSPSRISYPVKPLSDFTSHACGLHANFSPSTSRSSTSTATDFTTPAERLSAPRDFDGIQQGCCIGTNCISGSTSNVFHAAHASKPHETRRPKTDNTDLTEKISAPYFQSNSFRRDLPGTRACTSHDLHGDQCGRSALAWPGSFPVTSTSSNIGAQRYMASPSSGFKPPQSYSRHRPVLCIPHCDNAWYEGGGMYPFSRANSVSSGLFGGQAAAKPMCCPADNGYFCRLPGILEAIPAIRRSPRFCSKSHSLGASTARNLQAEYAAGPPTYLPSQHFQLQTMHSKSNSTGLTSGAQGPNTPPSALVESRKLRWLPSQPSISPSVHQSCKSGQLARSWHSYMTSSDSEVRQLSTGCSIKDAKRANTCLRSAWTTSSSENELRLASPAVKVSSSSFATRKAASQTTKWPRRKICSHEGCQNISKTRGLCKRHGGGERCNHLGCPNSAKKGGFCIRHGGGRCQAPGCTSGSRREGLCAFHIRAKRQQETNIRNTIHYPVVPSSQW